MQDFNQSIAFLILMFGVGVLVFHFYGKRRTRLNATQSIAEYEALIAALRRDLDVRTEEKAATLLRLSNLEGEVIELSSRNVTLREEKSKAAADLSQLATEHEALLVREEELRVEADAVRNQFVSLEATHARAIERISELEEITSTAETIETLREKLEAHENQHELVAVGLYPLSLDFATPDTLRAKLEDIRLELADMVRSKSAAICSTKWTINGSTSEGTRATRSYIRIMLRTFNADADACVDLVRWNNLDRCIERLRASFEYVNDLGSTHATALQKPYLDARLRQLHIMHEYRESVHRQKESMRNARQAAIEERRANLEIERARAEAEAEEKRYMRAIARAREEVLALVGHDRDQMLQKITELEQKLEQASFLKQRAISMAQITKAGFVYVVSNIGSFGVDVLKIGMTRRIDPRDRVRELGGASVPFHFDVHAMIYSENAPELENAFHRQFARQRINLANGRKEFFRVALSDVIEFSRSRSLEADFSTQPEARDFHISNRLRDSVLGSLSDEELNLRLTTIEPDPFEDTIDDDEMDE